MAMRDADIDTLITRINALLVLDRASSPSAAQTAAILAVQNQLDFITGPPQGFQRQG